MKTFRTAALGALVWLACLSPAGQAQSPSPPVDYDRLTQRHGLQDTFPDGTPAPTEPSTIQPPLYRPPDLALSNRLILVLFAGLIAVAGVFVVRNVIAYRRAARRYADELSQGPEPEVVVWGIVPEDSWDALLQRLRLRTDFDRALHEMLLAGIGYIQTELSLPIPKARTPREIQQHLPPDFRSAEDFETLVQGAEWAWFGAKPVDRDMFQRGLNALSRILQQRPSL